MGVTKRKSAKSAKVKKPLSVEQEYKVAQTRMLDLLAREMPKILALYGNRPAVAMEYKPPEPTKLEKLQSTFEHYMDRAALASRLGAQEIVKEQTEKAKVVLLEILKEPVPETPSVTLLRRGY